jgi:hypothetical protein
MAASWREGCDVNSEVMRRSRRPFVGRSIRPGYFALSLDVAQILAPATAGLFPGAATSPAGDGVAAGDFAAVLESLAGGQGALAGGQAAGAASPALAGLVTDEGLALVADLMDLETPAGPRGPRHTEMVTPSGEEVPEDGPEWDVNSE